jgi:type IV pilus assembly protein PilB
MTDKSMMGELLIEEGLLTKEQLGQALLDQKQKGGRLGYHLIRLGYLNVTRLSQFLKESMGLIPYNISETSDVSEAVNLFPATLARFYNVVPLERKGNTLTVALADLDNPRLIPALEEYTGLKIDPLICPRDVVVKALEKFYGFQNDPGVQYMPTGDNLFILSSKEKHIHSLHWSKLNPDSSAVEWLRTSLVEAIRIGCRRLVIRPTEDSLRIAFQNGEELEDRFSLHQRKEEEMGSLIEELARLKDRKKRAEQEGRIRLQIENRYISIHVHKLQTLQGRRYRLTLYDEKIFEKEWGRLRECLSNVEASSLESCLNEAKGVVLISGPMGPAISGVYYSILELIKSRFRSPFSIEMHALVNLSKIVQVELSRVEETTMAEQITLALKDEADCLGVFPLKDRSTAEIVFLAAAKASILGVIHQGNAAVTLKWLLRNGFKSPIRAGLLKGILSVVPVSKLCPHCQIPVDSPGLKFQLYTRQGCAKCLSMDTMPYETFLEWHPITKEIAPSEEGESDDSLERSSALLNYPQSLKEKILERARKGEIDGSEVRRLFGV